MRLTARTRLKIYGTGGSMNEPLLIPLFKVKEYLGIEASDTTYDAFLTEQILIISDAFERYCGRKFLRSNYTQTFYRDELPSEWTRELFLCQYPVHSIASILVNDVEFTDYRLVKDTGLLRSRYGFFYSNVNIDESADELTVIYNAGFDILPATLRDVFYNLISERYNKKINNVDLNFGSNVQRVSIPGTISIDYDYTLESNSSGRAFGVIVRDSANVLDQFKSERKYIGVLREGYVH